MIGRLTADPELRSTQSGVSSCRFTVAVNRKFKNEQTGEYDADFITCNAWRQTAEFITQYFSKGKLICVEGSLRNNNYQDKNHPDVTHYNTDVQVDNVEFVGSKNESGGSGSPAPAQQTYTPTAQPVQQQPAPSESESFMDLSDFEEILSDGDVPF